MDVFYWPLIDLLLWGLTSSYITSSNPPANGEISPVLTVVFGLLFWIVIWRSQYEVSTSLLQEIWDNNLINIFISPLSLKEWLFSTFCIGFIKVSISFIFASFFAKVFYRVDVLTLGPSIFFIILGLLIMGWAIGMIIASLTFIFGTKAQTLGSVVAAAISPFSAVFYPVTELPSFARKIADIIPISHFFEGLRLIIFNKPLDFSSLTSAYVFSVMLFVIAYFFVNYSFRMAKIRGLLRS
jgi:ABC-2 type transport system permease protein